MYIDWGQYNRSSGSGTLTPLHDNYLIIIDDDVRKEALISTYEVIHIVSMHLYVCLSQYR